MTIPDRQESVDEQLIAGSDKLVLLFGGISGGLGVPPFEFYKAANLLDCSKIFLRDLRQAWYQRGLPGVGDDARSIATYLAQKIDQSGCSDITFIGNSMGGFAALLFCSMIGRGRVIAFSPQSFISPSKRRLHGDRRWGEVIGAIHAHPAASDVYDLKDWMLQACPDIQARVFYSDSDRLDVVHAQELSGFRNIALHGFRDGGHTLVKKLRDEGTLGRILAGGDD
ncbi:hypothetical protein [Ideonella alba]|uniref:Alpha/beta hydrolase n=1 Tax=Ideonella alba TaxID=2824118 RepID=A0A940YAK1_9BURK|nr:hypothetical protein [Ideonella alba]MBQ0930683.1 hypothetical protein [Ideonella alba]